MECSCLDGFREMDTTVNIGSIPFGTPQESCIGKDGELLPYMRCGNLGGDPLLHEHRLTLATLLGSSVDLAREFGSAGFLLAGVIENAKTLKAGLLHELEQCLEMLLRLARKTDDEGGADCQPRNTSAHSLDQIDDVSAVRLPAH